MVSYQGKTQKGLPSMRLAVMVVLTALVSIQLNAMHNPQKPLREKIEEFLEKNNVKLVFAPEDKLPNILNEADFRDDSSCKLFGYKDSMENVLQDVQRKDGKVESDCTLFVQIASTIKQTQQQRKGFMLLIGDVTPKIMQSHLKDDVGYIAPCDEKVGRFLQQTPLDSKGQWIIKDGTNWLGFTTQDPPIVSQPLPTWLGTRKDKLQNELRSKQQDRTFSDLNPEILSIVDIYSRQNRLDTWCFDSGQQPSDD